MWLSLPVSVAAAAPQVAVVVVDLEAREEGYALELEDLVLEDALPIDVRAGETVQIVDPDGGRHPLDVAPGEAWVVSGPQGEAWMARIGEEVRTDVLVVRGTPDAVRGLAEALNAEVRAEGDRVWLVGRDLLFQAPWVEARGLHRLDEVAFVPVGQGPPPAARIRAVDGSPEAGPRVFVPAGAPREARPSSAVRAAAIAPSAPSVGPGEGDPSEVAEVVEPVRQLAPLGTVVSRGRTDDGEDMAAYVGLYACGDGTPLTLQGSGRFYVPGGTGDWYVSAPGIVHLELVKDATLMRAAIELERHYCRAVW